MCLLLSDTRVTHIPRLRFIRFTGYSDYFIPATFWSTRCSVLRLQLSDTLDTSLESSPYLLHRVLGSFVFTHIVESSYLVSTPQQYYWYIQTIMAVFAIKGTRIICMQLPSGVLVCRVYLSATLWIQVNSLRLIQQSSTYCLPRVLESFVSAYLVEYHDSYLMPKTGNDQDKHKQSAPYSPRSICESFVSS